MLCTPLLPYAPHVHLLLTIIDCVLIKKFSRLLDENEVSKSVDN
jgi:hypothetical protein